MHLIWLNLVPNLVLLFTGNFKELGSDDPYVLPPTVWEAIGTATAESGHTIPSAFGARVPNIAKEKQYFTAETWSFWSLYLAPALLHQRFQDISYYTHFLKLVKLLHICLQFEISKDEISKVRDGFRDWVTEFESLYYRSDPARISTCPITLHGLLHIADYIEAAGPVWTAWAFVMERYCGSLRPAIRSRRFPFASMDTHVEEKAQLSQIKLIYNLTAELSLSPPAVDIKAGDFFCNEYPQSVLMPPKVKTDLSESTGLRHKVAACLATRFNVSVAIAKNHIPDGVLEQWGKVRRLGGGDTMHARDLVRFGDGNRDASYVRYELLVDIYARQRRRAPEYEPRDFFGQLRRIIVVRLKPATELELERPVTILLAAIQRINASPANSDGMRFYKDMADIEVVDLASVQCVIGRVKDHMGQWFIIDRSGPMARAEFVDE
ncbi:hypothetical protein BD410DRAFT_816196 [Rickenella mellea]|uniref:Uncharacterized protein n=1 Tax=Rickenella mellea TaxID=50990 RepID=A0A4Y7PTY6_9AGAM|nr:hypothetical protein BD410DRAFT_816196 [Rickenella mellea]